MPTRATDQIIITIVGGGVFAPHLCEALAREVAAPKVEIRLSARRLDRLQVLAAHAARRLATIRPDWAVQAAPSLEAGIEGATLIILLVRVGGLEARAWDEEFPSRFGLIGDEGLGPGGIANAWRTLPELARIAQALARVAPTARVINLMAPLGVTTRLLLEQRLDAVGLCELPVTTLESWLPRAADSRAETSWHYGGLNHLGWFWDVRCGDEDVLQRVAASPAMSSGQAPVDAATLDRYQAAPLRYFYEIFDREAGRRLKLKRSPARAEQLIALSEVLMQQFSASPGLEVPEAKARPTPWLDRAVAPITSAMLDGPAHAGFANLLNGGTIPELPTQLVVEVAATYSKNGTSPVRPGPLPARVARFLHQAGEAEALTFQAATERDPGLLAEAIRALPLAIPENAVPELARLAQLSR